MNVPIGERWQGFVDNIVKAGRYGSASEVVREGLRLVEEREAKLSALQQTLNSSIERGGEYSDDDVGVAIKARLDAWERSRPQRCEPCHSRRQRRMIWPT